MAKSSDPLMKEAREQFSESQSASDFSREAFYEDMKFSRLSEQWPDEIAKQRKQEGRPALVINKLPALIRSVVNEARQNKPSIKVSPVDSGADEDTAEIIGGLIRNIERQSSAGVAYDTAIDHAVTGGFGFFRIDIDYAHDETFELEARIRRIANPLSVHWDTTSTQFDASDWDMAFVSDMLSEDEFKARYPKASLVPFDGDSRDEGSELWLHDEHIRVAEWFRRESKQTKLLLMAVPNAQTGQVDMQPVREDDLPAMARRFFQAGMIDTEGMSDKDLREGFFDASGVQVMRERMVEGYDVKRRIINGAEVLEEDDWPGSTIPICPVWGDEVFIDGRRHFRSLIRDAKDPQLMFNFWRSATTELVALAPKTPWVGPKGFVPKGQEAKWASANTRSHAYLEFEGAAAPVRQPFASVPSGALQEATLAAQDMNDITGIYPAAIGARSNETSGRAILARERQGDVSNFHFIDNLNRAIAYAGKVLVDIIPAVYSPKEAVRILGEDETAKVVNLTQEDGGSRRGGIDGQPRLYNLAVGKYDVDVKTGPNFATQREETRETLIEIMRQVPDAAPFVGDVLLDHMDFVGADKVAKRLKALLPPEVRQSEEAAENSDDPEKAALVQQNQALRQQAQQAQQAIMAEIDKIRKENEALKASHEAELKRIQLETQKAVAENENKKREIALKEGELAHKRLVEGEKIALEREKAAAGPPTFVVDQTGEISRAQFMQAEQLGAAIPALRDDLDKIMRQAQQAQSAQAEQLTEAINQLAQAQGAVRQAQSEDSKRLGEALAELGLSQARANETLARMAKAVADLGRPRKVVRDKATGEIIGTE
jgi:hypothetical protein